MEFNALKKITSYIPLRQKGTAMIKLNVWLTVMYVNLKSLRITVKIKTSAI